MTRVERAARYRARQRGELITAWPRRPLLKDRPASNATRLARWRMANPEKRAAQVQRENTPKKNGHKKQGDRLWNQRRGYALRRRRRWRERSSGRCHGPASHIHCWHESNAWRLLSTGARIPQRCCWCESKREVGMLEGFTVHREGLRHGKKAKDLPRRGKRWPGRPQQRAAVGLQG